MDIDFYKSAELDASVVLIYPRGMTTVLPAVHTLLQSHGKMIADEGDMSVDRARELVSNATGDTSIYYQTTTVNPKVWSILKEAVNRDTLRVLAVFHGSPPPEVPENVVTLDIGRSLHMKVPKPVIAAITDVLTTPGAVVTDTGMEMYYGLLSLCYEVLYDSEVKLFSNKVISVVPRARAFEYMYSPPTTLSPQATKTAILNFVEDVHGWME